jgi:hypothetical protein
VNSPFVNDPKKAPAWGANVVMVAPHTSGTIIIPPGTRSIRRLSFIEC